MIYLDLFLTFLEIGAFTFGGGYAMISLIRDAVLSHGWMTEGQLLNFIAVSESTPGPVAINMATFIGSSQGGILGAFFATLGVVLPSFVIILLISLVLKNILKYKSVQSVLKCVRPCVIGLILATAFNLFLSTLFNFSKISDSFSPDIKGILIFLCISVPAFIYEKKKKKAFSPILLIIISAVLGAIVYSIW